MDSLHALVLLAVIGVTLYVLIRHGERPVEAQSVFAGIGYGLLMLVFFVVGSSSLGYPFMQTLIPTFGVMLLYPALEDSPLQKKMTAFFFIAFLVLTVDYATLVSTDNYSQNPAFVAHKDRLNCLNMKMALQTTQMALASQIEQSPKFGEQRYPAGPFAQSGAWEALQESGTWMSLDDYWRERQTAHWTSKRFTYHRRWHTWLTGIYGKRNVATQLWYPGGKLKDAVMKMEYRDVGARIQ